MFKEYLEKICDREDLTRTEAAHALEIIISEEPTATEIGAFLAGLRVKSEAISELSGFADTMEKHMVSVKLDDPDAIDVCGTGGDGKHTFNVSTTVAFVAAAAGVTVAKHGNRSVSSKSGSADVLEKLGAKIDLLPEQTANCIKETGIGFFFAPLYHPAMRVIIPHRKNLGIRTFFNMLGPLLNPAKVKRQLIGAYNLETADKLIRVLQTRGSIKACTVHSSDGLDEVSPFEKSHFFEIKSGTAGVQSTEFVPPPFKYKKKTIAGGDSAENAQIILDVLKGKESPEYQITILNSAFALYVSGKADSVEAGLEKAQEVVKNGSALQKLNDYVQLTKKISA